MMLWYYKLLALHPKWVAFVVLVVSSVCIFVSLTFKELPDFTDPALVDILLKYKIELHFAIRIINVDNFDRVSKHEELKSQIVWLLGTIYWRKHDPVAVLHRISWTNHRCGRMWANRKIFNRSNIVGNSSSRLNVKLKYSQVTKSTKPIKNIENQSKKRKLSKDRVEKNNSVASSLNGLEEPNLKEDSNAIDRPIKKGGRKGSKNKRKKLLQATDGFFCDAPSKSQLNLVMIRKIILKMAWNISIDREYTHLVLMRSDGNSSLLEMDSIQAMCHLESQLTTIHSYKGFCQMKFYVKECCRPWSIPNYIALLSNKTNCYDIVVRQQVFLQTRKIYLW